MTLSATPAVRIALPVLAIIPVLLAAPDPAAAQPTPFAPAVQSRIDAVFAPFRRDDGPGCAVAVDVADELRYAAEFGLANLEHRIPIGPQTRFYAASVSKQVAAFAVALLAAEARLSLDDDVRRWIPEVPDLGETITVRHLLHHTSGLRDYFGLLGLTGWPSDGLLTVAAFLDLVSRQRALNFPPGEQYLYSNTGYVLLAILVERVAGQPLRVYAAERIFAPLGMADSQFRDDHRDLVPNLATAYAAAGAGYRTSMPGFDVVGDGGMYTTVRDLVRWARNYEHRRVGGDAAAELMLSRGVLRTGETIPYALGVVHGEHRGAATLEHGGAYGGYRAHLLVVPAERFVVATLCNAADANPQAMNRRVVDAVAGDRLAAVPAPAGPGAAGPEGPDDGGEANVAEAELARYAGLFFSDATESLLRFAVEGGRLALAQPNAPRLVPLGGGRFRLGGGGLVLEFQHDAAAAAATGLRLTAADGAVTDFVRVSGSAPSPAALAGLTGRYASPELGVAWTAELADGVLRLKRPGQPDLVLEPGFDDVLTAGGMLVRFHRDASGRATRFTLSAGRIRGILFEAEPAGSRVPVREEHP